MKYFWDACRRQNPDLYIFQDWEKHRVWPIHRQPGSNEDISTSSTKEQRTTTSTLLQYIVEGIIPLLSTFCVEYQKLFYDEPSVVPLKQEHKTILTDLGTAVAVSINYNWFLVQMILEYFNNLLIVYISFVYFENVLTMISHYFPTLIW